MREGRDGSREEGMGWRGRRKVNGYQTCVSVLTEGLARAARPYCSSHSHNNLCVLCVGHVREAEGLGHDKQTMMLFVFIVM